MKKYIVFDLDWTLSDTQKIHEQIESDFLKGKWVYIEPKTIWIKYAWRTPQEWIKEVLLSENIDFSREEIENFVASKDEIIISLLRNWKIDLMPYTFEILKFLNENDYKIW